MTEAETAMYRGMSMKPRVHSSLSAQIALACLFSALCCAGAFISIPIAIGPVPLALTNFFAILGALLLGPVWGAASTLLYIAIGALGFPVFSGGRGGIAHLIGPTGGYLVGYIAGAALSGLLSRRKGAFFTVLASVIGFVSILVVGGVGLKLQSGLPWSKAMAIGILPFLPGDAIKAILAVIIALRLGPFVRSLLVGPAEHA